MSEFFKVLVERQIIGFHLKTRFLANETRLKVSKLKYTAPYFSITSEKDKTWEKAKMMVEIILVVLIELQR